MSDKKENLPGQQGAKAAPYYSKRKEKKARLSEKAGFKGASGEADSKAPEPEKPESETPVAASRVVTTEQDSKESSISFSKAESNTPASEAPAESPPPIGSSSEKSSEDATLSKTKEAELTSKAQEPENPEAEKRTGASESVPPAQGSKEKSASFSEPPQAAGSAAKSPKKEGLPARDSKRSIRRTHPYQVEKASGGPGRGKTLVGFVILAIALILVALGSVYYTRFLVEKERQARESLSKQVAEQLETQSPQIDARIAAQVDEQLAGRVASEMDERLAGQEESLQQEVTNLKKEIAENKGDLKQIQQGMATLESTLGLLRSEVEKGPQPGNWDIAEAAYLMRIANERLQLGQNVSVALVALQAADRILRDMANPAFMPVRAKLAEEINSLKAVPDPDIDGMALSLTNIINRVKTLELKETVLAESVPASKAEGEAPEKTPEPEGNTYIAKIKEFLRVIWDDLKSLVVVKHRHEAEGGGIPTLLPEERYFLYQNLRLELKTARLNLLLKNEAAFQQSLELAQSWLQTYFQGSEAKVIKDTLAKLEQATIESSLPDISGSLKTLSQVLRHIKPQAARGSEGGRA
ncbi:uroporphyrinogen-III C-methyltransferase [Nitrosococcus oceani]|uniref:uroporphyrinogen-III C-methyltransferase n=1 Tax=Nitrosococcus oceani TaxID=1229 RepID=UPI0004E8F9E1|nr:uroporphyrinogen-III C-methyltransferase [Nitrosococcus oceani]KFI23603.1 uroporphyrin-III methyltransferase [Nitrosococcus oceani]